jgi:hypothetical protein
VTRRPAKNAVPFGGSSLACRCAARVAPRCAPSREGSVLPGVFYAEGSREHRLPRSRHGLGFSPGPAQSLSLRRPPHLPMRFHPPSSLPPPPECYGLRAALRAWLNLATQPIGRRAPPLGSSPSSRHQPPASTIPRGIPTPRSRSVPDVSHVLDGLLRQLPLRACFIPLPRPGFALQGFVPRAEPCRVSPAASCPPGVGRTRL